VQGIERLRTFASIFFNTKHNMAIRRNKKKADDTLVDLVEARDQAQDFFDNNQNYLLIGMVAIVLLIGGFFAYKYLIQAPKEKEAAAAMVDAQGQFARDSFALALQNNNPELMGFLDIIDEYGSTNAGNTANYYAGICYLHLGEYEAAASYLQDFDANDEVLPIMKNGALGDVYGELGDMDKAGSFYTKAIAAGENDFLESYYLMKLGKLNEKQGNFQASLDAYKRIKKDYPNTPDGRDIEKYIARAEARL